LRTGGETAGHEAAETGEEGDLFITGHDLGTPEERAARRARLAPERKLLEDLLKEIGKG
jgi:hypothetical protein